jgi:hypothetical protein
MKIKVKCDTAFFLKFKNKRALFCDRHYIYINELLNDYPYIDFDIAELNRGNIIIFKTQQLKDNFLNKYNLILKNEKENGGLNFPERHMLVGAYLGFPPKAVEYFAFEKYKMNGFRPVNIPISYYGLYFSSFPETIEDDKKWLENTYGKPFKNNMIDNYNDQLELKEISI